MDLKSFLSHQNISQTEFAERCELPQTTINTIVTGGGTRASTALKIISATGGLVTLHDLVRADLDG